MPPKGWRKNKDGKKKAEEEIKREPVVVRREPVTRQPAIVPAKETPESTKVIDKVVAMVRKELGPDSIHRLGDLEEATRRFPTGISSLDDVLGGGFPLAKLVQITGPESVGKTTLCNYLAARAQHEKIPVEFLDGELSEGKDRAVEIGVNPDLVTLSEPDTLEDAFTLMGLLIEHLKDEEQPSLIFLDSIAAFPLKSDLEREFDEVGRRAARAAYLSENLPKLVRPLKGTQIGVVFVNQVREKANAMPFEKNTYSPGGRALRHWCHMTLELKRVGLVKEKGEVVGIRTRVRVEKTKLLGVRPYGTAGIKIMFDGRVLEDLDNGKGGDD